MALRETPETMAASLRRAGINVQPPERDVLREQLEETLRRVQAGEALDELSRRDPEALCALATQRALTEHEALMLLARIEYLDMLLQAAAREREAVRAWSRRQQENAEAWGRSCAELGRALTQIAQAYGNAELAQNPKAVADLVCEYFKRSWCLLPIQDDRAECSDEVRPAEHAVAGAEALQQIATPGSGPSARTGLPRDATTAALAAASQELTELRKAMRLIAQTIAEPTLAQEPERLAHLVNEHFECLRTERMPDEPELRELVRDAAGLTPAQLGRLRQFARLMERDNGAVEEGLLELTGDALGRSLRPSRRPSANDNEGSGAPPVDVEAREALRELLSMALGVEVPADAPLEPKAVVRQVVAQWRGAPPAAPVYHVEVPEDEYRENSRFEHDEDDEP